VAVSWVASKLNSSVGNFHLHHIEGWTDNSTAKCCYKLGSHVLLYPNATEIAQTRSEHCYVSPLSPVFFILNESFSGPADKISVKRWFIVCMLLTGDS
jgi:hypothetical protein